MPNWCDNEMTVEGVDADKVNDAISNAAALFDVVAPMPAALSAITLGSVTIDGVRHNMWRETPDGDVPITDEELVELERTYGTASWKDWAADNWGTKWNVSRDDLEFDGETWTFQTAWAPPIPFYVALTTSFDVELDVFWDEPGAELLGEATIVKGRVHERPVD